MRILGGMGAACIMYILQVRLFPQLKWMLWTFNLIKNLIITICKVNYHTFDMKWSPVLFATLIFYLNQFHFIPQYTLKMNYFLLHHHLSLSLPLSVSLSHLSLSLFDFQFSRGSFIHVKIKYCIFHAKIVCGDC